MEIDTTADETARALMALVTDLAELEEPTARVRVQVYALAERHGVHVPRASSP